MNKFVIQVGLSMASAIIIVLFISLIIGKSILLPIGLLLLMIIVEQVHDNKTYRGIRIGLYLGLTSGWLIALYGPWGNIT